MAASSTSQLVRQLRRRALLHDGAGLSDEQLLTAFRSRRDEAALTALVRRHGSMVWGVCRRVLRNDHEAEDAFQATFLVLVRKAAAIAAPALVANWLYGVAHQTALKARATAARRGQRERQVVVMPEPAATAEDLATENRGRELQAKLDRELSALPEKYRVLIVLCDLEGKTRKEAARQLGCPKGTVAGRLARARVMLAKRLARYGVTLSGGGLAALLAEQAAAASAPTWVVNSTITAANALAAGQAAGSAVISAKALALAQGVLKTMLLNKLTRGVAAFIVVAALALANLGFVSSALNAGPQGGVARPRQPGGSGADRAAGLVGAVQADEKKPARIFISALVREDDKLVNQVLAVEPENGKWKKIADGGGRPRISPDGETALLGKSEGIWNCDTQGSNNPGLVSDKGTSAVWSPDGKQIVATSGKQEKGVWQVENWLMNADGGKPVRLPIHGEDHVHDWSPDGKWLLTVSDRDRIRIDRKQYINYGYQLYLVQPDGKEQRRLTKDGINLRPRFSPDGKRILYSYTRQDKVEGGWWIMDADGNNPREIFRREGLTGADSACWSPDGKQVALVLFDWVLDENGRKTRRPDENANFRIEIMDADGQNRRQLQLDNLKPLFLNDPDWR